MENRISTLKNLGPKTEQMLNEVDIFTTSELFEIGSVQAFQRLAFRFPDQVSLNALYAIEGAITDNDWRSLEPEVKERNGSVPNLTSIKPCVCFT